MKRLPALIITSLILVGIPQTTYCQIMTGQLNKFHQVLEKLYNDMIPLAGDLLTVAQAIGAFGALWYIGFRVWKHLAAAETIDFFPLFRPLVLSLAIGFYPSVLAIMNDLLKPTIIATKEMVKNSNNSVSILLEERRKAILGSTEWQDLAGGLGGENEDWEKYEQQEDTTDDNPIGSAMSFTLAIISNTIGYIIKLVVSFILQIVYFAAALCIDVMRTFHLLILSILGPFVLCLSIYDGFQHILPIWIARYINIYLWLPIANLFGAMIAKIQEGMLKVDLGDMANGNYGAFGQTDVAYLIFLIIAIIGYFSIPSIANYVVHAAGGNTLVAKTNSLVMTAGSIAAGGGAVSAMASSGGGGGMGAGSMAASNYGNDKYSSSMADAANSEPYLREGGGGYNYDKLSGKS